MCRLRPEDMYNVCCCISCIQQPVCYNKELEWEWLVIMRCRQHFNHIPQQLFITSNFKSGPGPEVEAFWNNHDCWLESQNGMQMNGECCPNSKRRATACKDPTKTILFSKLSSLSQWEEKTLIFLFEKKNLYSFIYYHFWNKNLDQQWAWEHELENSLYTVKYPTHKKYSSALIFAIFASWGS